MPDVYWSTVDSSDSMTTRVMTFTGVGAPFGSLPPGSDQLGPSVRDFLDGLNNTILFAGAGADMAVPWTKPEDLSFDVNDPLAALGDLSAGEFRVAFGDGSVVMISADVSPVSLAALVTPDSNSANADSGIPNEELMARRADRELRRTGQLDAPELRTHDLKSISIAMNNFENTAQRFPAGISGRGDGPALLSWRVQLLPNLGFYSLFLQFRFEEPWNSPHNLAILELMPDFYRTSGDPWNSVTTRVKTFTGPGTPFPSVTSVTVRGPGIRDISDGVSRTIALIETGSGTGVPWTKPTDLPLHTNNPFSPLGDLASEFSVAFFNAHIVTYPASITTSELNALITHQGGEDITNPPQVPNLADFFVTQTADDTANNEFGVDSFDVVLDRKPSTDVVLALSVSDSAIGTLDKSTLRFTSSNWNVPQRVGFRAVDNQFVNPDAQIDVTVSVVSAQSDQDYQQVAAQVFSALVRDDESRALVAGGDYDLNGVVDSADYSFWRNLVGTTDLAPFTGADGNGDGEVNSLDYEVWRTNFVAGADPLAADFDNSGAVDAGDIDLLAAAVRGEITVLPEFDLDDSGTVDRNDLDELILNILNIPYGDADLNGVVNTADYNQWHQNAFTAGTGWETGDFNNDGLTDVRDFNVWNGNKFIGQTTQIVPNTAAGRLPRAAGAQVAPQSSVTMDVSTFQAQAQRLVHQETADRLDRRVKPAQSTDAFHVGADMPPDGTIRFIEIPTSHLATDARYGDALPRNTHVDAIFAEWEDRLGP